MNTNRTAATKISLNIVIQCMLKNTIRLMNKCSVQLNLKREQSFIFVQIWWTKRDTRLTISTGAGAIEATA